LIAKNKAYDYLRNKTKEEEAIKSYVLNETNNINYNDEYTNQEKLLDELYSDIKSIVDSNVYNIIILHTVYNMKFEEIAKEQNVTSSVVRGIYHRGMKKIKKELNYEKYKKIDY
ncbi:MAG: sigma-70 family RNA polymerase sigma factor, partial [Bacillales bacterium]|nr:sigma-70 family RNA polymerase sigma factor [Bacillales bacterium]